MVAEARVHGERVLVAAFLFIRTAHLAQGVVVLSTGSYAYQRPGSHSTRVCSGTATPICTGSFTDR